MEFDGKKCHVLEMGKSAMRPSWTYKLGENIISIAKEYKDLGVVIQDNLSSEKYIDRIFGDTFRMLRKIRITFHLDKDMMRKIIRNIQMAFHFLDKDMMRKNISTMIRPNLEYAEVYSLHTRKNMY